MTKKDIQKAIKEGVGNKQETVIAPKDSPKVIQQAKYNEPSPGSSIPVNNW